MSFVNSACYRLCVIALLINLVDQFRTSVPIFLFSASVRNYRNTSVSHYVLSIYSGKHHCYQPKTLSEPHSWIPLLFSASKTWYSRASLLWQELVHSTGVCVFLAMVADIIGDGDDQGTIFIHPTFSELTVTEKGHVVVMDTIGDTAINSLLIPTMSYH